MPDMLVRLYALPDARPGIEQLASTGVTVRRPMAHEKAAVVDWVRETFSVAWSGECDVSFSNHPISCFVAVKEKAVIGFACYDSTCKNFFGPTGVAEEHRSQGIGRVLLLACLHAMAANGYGYAIIGGAGPTDFYTDVVGAIPIEGSTPGIYPNTPIDD
jgi:ribosomal protein S18 acetylase RimI-like enzyme